MNRSRLSDRDLNFPPSRLFITLAFITIMASGCSGFFPVPPTPTKSILVSSGSTPTVFTPLEMTPTPAVISVFVDPALPQELQDSALSMDVVAGRTVKYSSSSEEADVVIGLNPDRPLSTWIYALAAPFPTVRDTVTMASVHRWWEADCSVEQVSGESDSSTGDDRLEPEENQAMIASPTPEVITTCPEEGLFLTADVFELMQAWLGEAGTSVHQCTGDCSLLEESWEQTGLYAVIPYEKLEPRWKVLTLDNQSPLAYDFDPEDYLLSFEFGLSGSAEYDAEFIQRLAWPESNYVAEKRTVVALTGVTALTRAIAWRMEAEGVQYPAEQIGDWLLQADITHVSNEVSFTEDCGFPDPEQRELRFCSSPDYFDLLLGVDVELVELTGNHILDYGDEPFLNSLDLYESAGMQWFGGGENLDAAREPVLITHNGNQLAFFGCNKAGPVSTWAGEDEPGSNPCDEETYAIISRLSDSGYLTFFTYQWYEAYMSRADNSQAYGFQKAVDAGASVVSGSQAHQPMGFQFYNGGFIHYGPGNLFFDQMWSQETREEFVAVYTVYDGELINIELKTALLEDFSQPRPMTRLERQDFLERMFTASRWDTALE